MATDGPRPRWRSWCKRGACLALLLAVAAVALRCLPHAPLSDAVSQSRAVYARGGELLRLSLAPDAQYRLWVPLPRMAPSLVQAVLLYEDRRFYWHPGVNPVALGRSVWSMASGGRRKKGDAVQRPLE